MSEIPELDNWESEIDPLLESDLESKRQLGLGKAFQRVVVGLVNSRFAISGLRQTLGKVANNLRNLIRIWLSLANPQQISHKCEQVNFVVRNPYGFIAIATVITVLK
jgi:hypothetical protein